MSELMALQILGDRIDDGSLESDAVEPRHKSKIYGGTKIDDSTYEFYLERHPHLFGKPSLGAPSPAFARVELSIEVNLFKKTAKVVKSTLEELQISYGDLACEHVDSLSEA